PELGAAGERSSGAERPAGSRPVWSTRRRELLDTPVYAGEQLHAGFAMAGPAIVELPTTTIVVPEEFELIVDDRGAFLLCADEHGRSLASKLAPGIGAAR
ncbi:MAG: hydantoinase/oxoprolinase family protein, partial [Solirubrobacteraceae bacterium]